MDLQQFLFTSDGILLFILGHFLLLFSDENKDELFPYLIALSGFMWMIGLYNHYDIVSTFAAIALVVTSVMKSIKMDLSSTLFKERYMLAITVLGTIMSYIYYRESTYKQEDSMAVYASFGYITSILLLTGSSISYLFGRIKQFKYHLYILLSCLLATYGMIDHVSNIKLVPIMIISIIATVGVVLNSGYAFNKKG